MTSASPPFPRSSGRKADWRDLSLAKSKLVSISLLLSKKLYSSSSFYTGDSAVGAFAYCLLFLRASSSFFLKKSLEMMV
jgi:hypothetical protein